MTTDKPLYEVFRGQCQISCKARAVLVIVQLFALVLKGLALGFAGNKNPYPYPYQCVALHSVCSFTLSV